MDLGASDPRLVRVVNEALQCSRSWRKTQGLLEAKDSEGGFSTLEQDMSHVECESRAAGGLACCIHQASSIEQTLDNRYRRQTRRADHGCKIGCRGCVITAAFRDLCAFQDWLQKRHIKKILYGARGATFPFLHSWLAESCSPTY